VYLHSSQHSGEFYSILDIWSTRRRLDYLLSLHGRGKFTRTSLSATLPFTSTIYIYIEFPFCLASKPTLHCTRIFPSSLSNGQRSKSTISWGLSHSGILIATRVSYKISLLHFFVYALSTY